MRYLLSDYFKVPKSMLGELPPYSYARYIEPVLKLTSTGDPTADPRHYVAA